MKINKRRRQERKKKKKEGERAVDGRGEGLLPLL
jgi:hypothetical protein